MVLGYPKSPEEIAKPQWTPEKLELIYLHGSAYLMCAIRILGKKVLVRRLDGYGDARPVPLEDCIRLEPRDTLEAIDDLATACVKPTPIPRGTRMKFVKFDGDGDLLVALKKNGKLKQCSIFRDEAIGLTIL